MREVTLQCEPGATKWVGGHGSCWAGSSCPPGSWNSTARQQAQAQQAQAQGCLPLAHHSSVQLSVLINVPQKLKFQCVGPQQRKTACSTLCMLMFYMGVLVLLKLIACRVYHHGRRQRKHLQYCQRSGSFTTTNTSFSTKIKIKIKIVRVHNSKGKVRRTH